ncbi:probable tubulin polyglutamylase TTLL2 [Eucyclogobius newberryi]|uniref:probable tubulin polyglutamylase TTLL2 n=1 Tax=Eucyclogobius newberryi TaxID=166745 RepID=UPI003B5CF49F
MAASLVFRLHDRGPELVREVLLERGWEEYDKRHRQDADWNLYWRASLFHKSDYYNLMPWQRLNHHPKTVGITRKDFLTRNLRRMRTTFGPGVYDFSPVAFILPNDYTRFLTEYNRQRVNPGQSVHWICKPVDLSRGRGIFIFEDIKDLVYDSTVIVQRYISNPLLISGYKFDLRIYVCVKSFSPLTVYIHQEGLVRFATEKYQLSNLRNLYSHLTNTSINKFSPFYKTDKGKVGQGCKWTMSKFRHFLHCQEINELLLWQRINNIVTLTLLAIAPSVPHCPNCVELLGFDILIDVKLKPWLLEVNYSPALTLDCQADITVKKGLISDLIDLMNYRWVDRFRDKAYKRKWHKCLKVSQSSYVSMPALTNVKCSTQKVAEKKRSQVDKLPFLKTKSQQKSSDLVSRYQRHLPPVEMNNPGAKSGMVSTTSTMYSDNRVELILEPRTKLRGTKSLLCPAITARLPDLSEVTNHDEDETEAEVAPCVETDVSFSTCDTPQQERGSTDSWRLPNIHSVGQRPINTASSQSREKGAAAPPLRVGDFIRTFPFNSATLRASQDRLDVRTVIQELLKLTTKLSYSSRFNWRRRLDSVRDSEGDGGLESLFWGPRDPPLISQCLKH